MKSINLKQVAACSASMSTDSFKKWSAIHGVALKSRESDSIRSFVEDLCTLVQDPDEIYRITDNIRPLFSILCREYLCGIVKL